MIPKQQKKLSTATSTALSQLFLQRNTAIKALKRFRLLINLFYNLRRPKRFFIFTNQLRKKNRYEKKYFSSKSKQGACRFRAFAQFYFPLI